MLVHDTFPPVDVVTFAGAGGDVFASVPASGPDKLVVAPAMVAIMGIVEDTLRISMFLPVQFTVEAASGLAPTGSIAVIVRVFTPLSSVLVIAVSGRSSMVWVFCHHCAYATSSTMASTITAYTMSIDMVSIICQKKRCGFRVLDNLILHVDTEDVAGGRGDGPSGCRRD